MSTPNTHPCHPEHRRGIHLGQEKWGSTGRNIRTFLSVSSLTWWATRDVSTSLSLRSTWQENSPSVMKGWRSTGVESRGNLSRKIVWFTLVELIVVITILVILGTIAFVSLGGFSGSARDSSRVSDLSLIGKGLDIHYTKLWSFPSPTSSTGITFGSSSSVVWYQGTIGEWVIRSLGWAWARISTKPVDPLSKEEYRYSLPTGVNEYLLSADYEGDSVALLQNWELRAENWGTPDGTSVFASAGEAIQVKWPFSFFSSIAKNMEDVTGIATLRSRWQDFTPPVSASTGSPTISYLKGTYNGVATRVSSGSTINIIALPSIFLSSGSTGTIVDASSRNFLLQGKTLSWVSFAPKVVYSSGALPSNDTERLLFSSGIVAAYSGTSLATNSDIKSFIDNVNSTGSLSAIGGNFVRNKFGGNGPSIVATASSASSSSYSVGNSLMFNGSNQFLSRTGAVNGNRQKWTFSAWIKPSAIWATNAFRPIFAAGTNNLNETRIGFNYGTWDAADRLIFWNSNTWGSWDLQLTTNAVFRDPAAWYHIVCVYDTTVSNPSNAIALYVNGNKITSFASATYPSQWAQSAVNNTNENHYLGRISLGFYAGQYLADVNLVDSGALSPTDFATTDANGQWVPKQFTGDYGTNGFHLDFSSGATTQSLGSDSSGKWNHWTVNNMTVAGNQMIDTPTNNFAMWNPLDTDSGIAPSNGNLLANWLSGGSIIRTTISPSVKTYWEVTLTNGYGISAGIGQSNTPRSQSSMSTYAIAYSYQTITNGTIQTSQPIVALAQGDTIGLAFDPVAGALNAYVNGSLQKTWTGISTNLAWVPYIYLDGVGSPKATINFWQWWQDFATGNKWPSAPYSDDGWIGKFRYQPPAGFKALSTANLPDPAILNPKQYFDVLTWTGDGNATRSIGWLSFQPDFVWAKPRNAIKDHHLLDVVRGANKILFTNDMGIERTSTTSFSDGSLGQRTGSGFTIVSGTTNANNLNANGQTNVAWNWRAGWGTSPDTNGSISSQVSANQSAGFSIVTFSGAGSSGTIGHGLGKVPAMAIFKSRNNIGTAGWNVWHQGLTGGNYYLALSNTSQQSNAASNFWGSWTTTTFSLTSTPLTSDAGVVAYLWSEVPWFSKFGSYVGNGSVTGDGPFVYTGFRPRYVMIKRVDTNGYGWEIHDTARSLTNPLGEWLFANDASIESGIGSARLDILSNGFKLRSNDANWNAASPATYIYAAFAETPFKYATAR